MEEWKLKKIEEWNKINEVDQKDKEIEQTGQVVVEELNAYSLSMYEVRSQVTRDCYLHRLRIFLNHIGLVPEWLNVTKGKETDS